MTKPELRVTALTKRYKQAGNEVVAADAITIAADGGVVGILGPNGSGKKTTIKSILGLVTPDAGAISLCGFDPVRNRRELLHRCGAVLEGADLSFSWAMFLAAVSVGYMTIGVLVYALFERTAKRRNLLGQY